MMWTDFQQQERIGERYQQELISLAQRFYESLALARLAFAPNPNLEALLQKAEAMVTTTDSIFPTDASGDVSSWTSSTDLPQVTKQGQAEQMHQIVGFLQPVSDLLDCLSPRVNY